MSMEFRTRNIENINRANNPNFDSLSFEERKELLNHNMELLSDIDEIKKEEKDEYVFQESNKEENNSLNEDNSLQKLNTLNDEIEKDEFYDAYLFTSQEEYREQFIELAKELKNKYGDKFILMMDKSEEEKYLDLYSKGYKRPKLEVIKDYKEYIEKKKNNLPKPDLIFYHGGASSDFNIDKLDVTRLSEKQQNNSNSYAGFYMYDENNKTGAYHYAEQENNRKHTNDLGVVKLYIDPNLKIYDYNEHHSDMFGITRLSQNTIKELMEQGYDLIKGKVLSKTEYVLLNKDKIKNIEFIPVEINFEQGEINKLR